MKLKAEKWVNNGFTISHMDGMPYFIKGLVPGEVGDCSITKKTTKFIHVNAEEVLESSPERIKSDCAIFPECGGCSFRHITYENELNIKKRLLTESIRYTEFPEPNLIHSFDSGYRNNVQLKIQNGQLGFFKTGTNQIISLPADGCKNLAPELNEFIIQNKKGLSLSQKKEIRLRLTNMGIVEYSDAESEFLVTGHPIRIPRNGFFQINRFLIEPWLHAFIEYSPQAEHIIEFFSGSGMLSIALKNKYNNLTGFELEKSAVTYAEKNAKINNLNHVKYIVKNLYEQEIELPVSNYWIFNPPRNGLNNRLIHQIKNKKPETILYSSCNYITLARDLKDLNGLYKIENISLIDFFPRTPYFETLVKLKILS